MSGLSPLPSLDAIAAIGPDNLTDTCPHVPAPQPLNAVRKGIKERLDELDRKERDIVLERLQLKSRWNRSLMATQLPNEILIMIFVYSSAGRPLPFTGRHDGDYFKFAPKKTQWAKLMLVCRHWCDVVRATPALWRTIDVGKNKAWMELALTRSKSATIDVSFSSHFYSKDAAILEPHYHRLRSLRLRSWSPIALSVIPVANFVLLESLEITNDPKDRILHNRKYVITDRGITHERLPNLRTLQVSHSDVPSDPLFYTRLRKLSLRGCLIQSSLEHFVELVSESPNLVHLELDDFLQQLSDSGNFTGPPRVLSSLRSLRLGDHRPVYSARFLARIVIPAASLSITADINPDDDDDDEEEEEEEETEYDTLCTIVPPNLRDSLPQLMSVTCARLKVMGDDFALECHPTALEPNETPLVSLGLISSTKRADWDGNLQEGIADFLALFGSAPLTHFKTVGVCESDASGSEAWSHLFRTSPSLVLLEVDINDFAIEGLLEASLASPEDGPVVYPEREKVVRRGQVKQVDPLKHGDIYQTRLANLIKIAGASSRFTYAITLDESMSGLSPLASLDAVAVGPDNLTDTCPHMPAPQPLNDVRQGIKERLDELDRKEREIFLERLELKSRWNRSLLATQLPNEILTLIFVYSSAGWPLPPTEGLDGDYFKSSPKKGLWTKFMLVCRHWCAVARATPALWRTIDVGKNKAWMQLALTRSDGATVDVSFSSNFDEEDAAILEPHYHRLRSLRLRCWSPTAFRVIRGSLPRMESFEVLGNPRDSFSPKGIYTVTDLGITRQRFPDLRTLQVVRTPLPVDPLFYNRLCRLSLKGCPIQSSLEQFVKLLSDSPGLRHLELDDFLQQLSDSENIGPLVSLPSLRSLCLNSHLPMFSARFLSRVVTAATSLSITANVDFGDGDHGAVEDDTLCAILPQNFRTSLPQLTNVTWCRLTTIYEENTIACHPTIPEPDETPLVKLSLTSSTGPNWECRLSDGIADLLALFSSAPVTHLATLGHTLSTVSGVESWVRLFRGFPALVSLEADIDDMVLTGFLVASLMSPRDGPVVCRGLEHITLNDEWGHLREVRVEPVFDPLVRCLLYRAERGTRLEELRLEFHRTARVAIREKLPSSHADEFLRPTFLTPNLSQTTGLPYAICRDWVNASRHNLFSSITLDFKRCDALMDQIILRHSPSIQPYLVQVHELILVGIRLNPRSESGFSVERTFGGGSFHTLVGWLPNLRVLSFVACDFRHSVHPRVHMTLSRFSAVRVPELKNCAFPSFHTVRWIITALVSLEQLIMVCPTWDAGPTSAQLVALDNCQNRPALRTLELSVANHGASIAKVLIEWLLGTRSRLSLHTLKLSALDCPSNLPLWASYANILESFPSVSELRVCAFEHEGTATPLRYLTALEDLEITRLGSHLPYSPASLFASPSPVLHNISVELRDRRKDRPRGPPIAIAGLELLDPVLAHPKFHRLEVVHFAIQDTFAIGVIAPPTFSCAPIVHDLQKYLPKLYARGIVRVSVTTTAPLHPAITGDVSSLFRAVMPGLPKGPSGVGQ
ncbi:hypothetical protein V8D89_001948 [Ganoderma adspersum]